jgi:hypothetical protein
MKMARLFADEVGHRAAGVGLNQEKGFDANFRYRQEFFNHRWTQMDTDLNKKGNTQRV